MGFYTAKPKILGLTWMIGNNRKNVVRYFFEYQLFPLIKGVTISSPISCCGNLKGNIFSDFLLSRNITVPRPGIRVGFIPGGSTDSVSFQ